MKRSHRDERGLGGIEGLAFGVLIFVFGTLLVVNAWGVIDAKLAAGAAAREGARALVEAGSLEEGQRAASVAADAAMAGHNHELHDLTVESADGFSRCREITIVATTKLPRIALPQIGSGGGEYAIRARHTELVDPYRSGLPGTASCSVD